MLYFSEIQYKKRLGLSLNTTGNDRKLLFLSQAKKHCAQWGQINYEVELELFFKHSNHKSTYENSNVTLKRFWPNCVTLHHKTSICKTKISQSNIILVFFVSREKISTEKYSSILPFYLHYVVTHIDLIQKKVSFLIYIHTFRIWVWIDFFLDFKQAKKVIQWFQVQNWASRTGLNISDSTLFLLKYLRVEIYCLIFMRLQFHEMT